MKKIFTEKNIASLLFILVMVFFSFAHEDSKKRSEIYNVSSSEEIKNNNTVSDNLSGKDLSQHPEELHQAVLK